MTSIDFSGMIDLQNPASATQAESGFQLTVLTSTSLSQWLGPPHKYFLFLCFFGLGVAALVYLATFTALYAFLWLLRL